MLDGEPALRHDYESPLERRDDVSDAWAEYYRDKGIDDSRVDLINAIHRKFLLAVLHVARRIREKIMLIEVGVGIGGMTCSLLDMAGDRGIPVDRVKIVGVDNSKELIARTEVYARDSLMVEPPAYVLADAFHLPFRAERAESTVIFHQGFLEHFDDDNIRRILENQLEAASRVVFSVPSHNYEFRDGIVGNERFMSMEDWMHILAPFEVEIGFYYGKNSWEEYHLCFIVRKKEIV